MSNKDVIDALKKAKINDKKVELDKYGSWAVYKDVNNAKELSDDEKNKGNFPKLSDEELSEKIKPQYMLVGLSVSKRGTLNDSSWENFHDIRTGSNDNRMKKMISDNESCGGYITDIIKFPDDPDDTNKENKSSNHIYSRIINSCKNYEKNSYDCRTLKFSIEAFQYELKTIKPKKIIFFGRDAFNLFKKGLKKELLNVPDSNNVKVKEIAHFSLRRKKCIMDSYKHEWHTIDEVRNMSMDEF